MSTQRTTRTNGHLRIQTINSEPTMTQQQFKDEVNINNIMKKYQRTGVITHLNNRQGKFADISNAPDYLEAQQIIVKADQAFDQLPSDIRQRFHNDPAEMLAFINNPKNHDEGVKLGIFDAKLPPLNSSPAPTNNKNDDLNDENSNPSPAPKNKKTQN